MIDNDYTFGEASVYCDGCGDTIDHIEGFDGRVPSFDVIEDAIHENRWTSKKEDGEWKHYCEGCSS
jgi:hypothetical protein